MPAVGAGSIFLPTNQGQSVNLEHLCKDFLRDAQFLSEVSDIVSGGADERLRGDVCADFSQLSLNHSDTLL